jgi:hypothetical protein
LKERGKKQEKKDEALAENSQALVCAKAPPGDGTLDFGKTRKLIKPVPAHYTERFEPI